MKIPNSKFQMVKVLVPSKLEEGSKLEDIFGKINYTDSHGSTRSVEVGLVKENYYEDFIEYDGQGIREGKWIVNSFILEQFINYCDDVVVPILNLGSLTLKKSQVLFNVKIHSMIFGIHIELFEDTLFIMNPEWCGIENLAVTCSKS